MKPVKTPTTLYRIYDKAGALLYIGITNSVAIRWNSHQRVQPWWGEMRSLTVDWYDSREEAEAAEEAAIKAERPKYNVTYLRKPTQKPALGPYRPVIVEPGSGQARSGLMDAAAAGEKLGQSANWMKTQARAGKIPFTRLGREMRWTPQHLAEILRAGEQRPHATLTARAPARRKAADAGVTTLQARTPRRKRNTAA